MRVVIVIGWPRAQKATNTTVWLYTAAWNRGHEVWFLDYLRFGLSPDGRVTGKAIRPRDHGARITRDQVVRALQTGALEEAQVDLSSFDLALLRNNPNDRLSTWTEKVRNPAAQFGRLLARHGVRVINRPDMLEATSDFLWTSDLPAADLPATLIGRGADELRAFIRELGRPVVLKPLNGSGGDGIFRVDRPDDPNLGSMLQTLASSGYVVAQEFMPEAEDGDVRALLWRGRPLALAGGRHSAYRRVHHAEDFRNNIHAGGERAPVTLDQAQLALLERVGARLARDGIWLAGVDLAGARLIEVNVFAPGGAHNLHALYGQDVCVPIFEDLERRPPSD